MKRLLFLLLFIPVVAFTQDKKQCAGITVKGKQCNNYVKAPATHCHFHNPNTPRCGHKKKDGTPCKMIVKKAGLTRHIHAGK